MSNASHWLVLEASGPVAGVAALDAQGGLIWEKSFETQRRETGPLFSSVQEAVKATGRPRSIVVGTGPGSYNGLRSVMALARGLALAWACPLHGLPSLCGISGPPGRYLVFGDARSQQVFRLMLEDGVPEGVPVLDTMEGAEAIAREQGVPLISTAKNEGKISVSQLAAIAVRHPDLLAAAEPLYLKPPHITPARVGKVASLN